MTKVQASYAVCIALFFMGGSACVSPLQFIVQINKQVLIELGHLNILLWMFTGVWECNLLQRSTTS